MRREGTPTSEHWSVSDEQEREPKRRDRKNVFLRHKGNTEKGLPSKSYQPRLYLVME